jgi:hypothetical protein
LIQPVKICCVKSVNYFFATAGTSSSLSNIKHCRVPNALVDTLPMGFSTLLAKNANGGGDLNGE